MRYNIISRDIKMYQTFNRYRILQEFFDRPNKRFQLRELSRETGIGLPSVRNHVIALRDEGLVSEVEEGLYPSYKLGVNRKTRAYKRENLIIRLEDSGLLDELEKKLRPNCIVLYGSAVDGRDDERGDIDIYVQAEEGVIDLREYEKELNRKITFMYEPEIKKLNRELLNSLANGITLRGFLKVL